MALDTTSATPLFQQLAGQLPGAGADVRRRESPRRRVQLPQPVQKPFGIRGPGGLVVLLPAIEAVYGVLHMNPSLQILR